ncbi:unnamed protein product [Arctogadus glacialis]
MRIEGVAKCMFIVLVSEDKCNCTPGNFRFLYSAWILGASGPGHGVTISLSPSVCFSGTWAVTGTLHAGQGTQRQDLRRWAQVKPRDKRDEAAGIVHYHVVASPRFGRSRWRQGMGCLGGGLLRHGKKPKRASSSSSSRARVANAVARSQA